MDSVAGEVRGVDGRDDGGGGRGARVKKQYIGGDGIVMCSGLWVCHYLSQGDGGHLSLRQS